MPALLRMHLNAAAAATPRQLLGAAAAICENHDADHHAAVKPFSVGLLTPGQSAEGDHGGSWTVGWLPDAGLPPGWPPATVRFGSQARTVAGFDGQVRTYAELAASPPTRRAALTTTSPLFFSRNGRDLPLPEPVLIMRGLLTRWNTFAPVALRVTDDDATALFDTVFLDEMTGTTRKTDIAPGLRQVGFDGQAQLRLLRTAAEHTTRIFAALLRFAEFAGVGAQTTAGFGRVTVDLDPPRGTQTGQAVPEAPRLPPARTS